MDPSIEMSLYSHSGLNGRGEWAQFCGATQTQPHNGGPEEPKNMPDGKRQVQVEAEHPAQRGSNASRFGYIWLLCLLHRFRDASRGSLEWNVLVWGLENAIQNEERHLTLRLVTSFLKQPLTAFRANQIVTSRQKAFYEKTTITANLQKVGLVVIWDPAEKGLLLENAKH